MLVLHLYHGKNCHQPWTVLLKEALLMRAAYLKTSHMVSSMLALYLLTYPVHTFLHLSLVLCCFHYVHDRFSLKSQISV